jgi:hypothetical protein
MDASVSWFVFEFIIIGMNLSILISMAIHKNNQFELDIAISVLIIIVDDARNRNGLLK